MTEKEIAGLMQNLLKEHLDTMTIFVKQLASNAGLFAGVDIPLADETVCTITNLKAFLLLTRVRNYSKGRYTTWLEATLTRLLMP